MKKFELTPESITFGEHTLFCIKALADFGCVKAGDLGGWVEKEENLSHDGDARVCDDARIESTADYATVKGFGSVYRNSTFFRLKSGDVGVACGCFHGTLEEFRAKVRDTYPDDKKGKEYLMLADLMEYRFRNGGEVTGSG